MTSRCALVRIIVAGLIALCFAQLGFAQSTSGSVTGRVFDPNAAVIIEASVTATNTATGVTTKAETNDQGLYHFSNLEPGTYRFTVSKQGFKLVDRPDVVVHVGDTIALNFNMQVGAANESVTVEGGAPLVNTESAAVSTVIERQVVASMPLPGRSFQGLITLAPGVNTVPAGATPGQFVVNGQRSDTNYFTVDGVSANGATPNGTNTISNGTGSTASTNAAGGFQNMVSVDALEEFRITTSSFAPEFGRSPGGQVSLVTRSGTNAFHGDAFDYLRNTVLDANDWFLNSAAKPRGIVQQNDFGGVLGGPIVKNKLFFFFSYEGLRLNAPAPSVKQVPTQSARNLAAAAANNGGVVGYMAQYLNGFPLPNGGNIGATCTNTNTCVASYTASFPSKIQSDTSSARVDYALSQRHHIFGRWSHTPSNNSAAVDTFITNTAFLNNTYTAGWTYAATNSLSNDARFNFSHARFVQGRFPTLFKGTLSTIFPAGFAQPPAGFDATGEYTLQFSFTNMDPILIAPKVLNHSSDQINITDAVTWVRGAHQLKFGADYRRSPSAATLSPYGLNNSFAQSPGNANNCPGGLPSYICGQANGTNIQHVTPLSVQFTNYSFFGQDTWRATYRLTATYGVRWDINPAMGFLDPIYPVWSVASAGFNPANLSTMQLNPLGARPYATRYGDLAPRLGLAYQVSKSSQWASVVRAGYGVFYDTGASSQNSVAGPFNARCNNLAPCTLPPFTGPALPFVPYPIAPANIRFITPPVFPTTFTFPLSLGTDSVVDPRFKQPYVHQANLALEQQLPGNQNLTVGYVGAFGRHLVAPLLFPPNKTNPNLLGAGAGCAASPNCGDSITFYGNYADSEYNALQLKLQRQAKALGWVASYTWSHSIDNNSTGLSTSLNGTAVQAEPTAANLAAGIAAPLLRASSDFDIRQNFSFSLVYDTPNSANGVVRAFLGHWTLAPIFHYQSAPPIDIVANTTGTLGGAQNLLSRPNLIPGIPIYVTGATCAAQYAAAGRGSLCPGGKAFNNAVPTAAQAAAAGCLAPTSTNARGPFCTPALVGTQAVSGNVGRNFARGFALSQLDFSLHRDFPIRESIRLRFETDMFNVFNHPMFGPTGANVSLATYGFTSAMLNSFLGSGASFGSGFNPTFNTGGPRNFQFALKLLF